MSTLERDDQKEFVKWLRDVAAARWPRECIPGLGFPFVASHSAGKRSKRAIGAAKGQGLRAGVPDIFIPIPRGQFAGLWLELKRKDDRAVESDDQKAWLMWLNLHGFYGRFVYGVDAAKETTIRYMEVRAI